MPPSPPPSPSKFAAAESESPCGCGQVWLQPGQRVLSVAADTQFCERICYDWVVEDRGSEGAMVDLSFEIVFRSIVHAPAWDVLSRGVVSRVSSAFVERVAEVAAATADGSREPTSASRHRQRHRQVRDATLPGNTPAVAEAGGTAQPGGAPAHESSSLAEMGADASSWLLNTTAAVVGVPLRVVSVDRPGREGPRVASARGGAEPEAVGEVLSQRPRAELIKELQVLERRVAALKSALRAHPQK